MSRLLKFFALMSLRVIAVSSVILWAVSQLGIGRPCMCVPLGGNLYGVVMAEPGHWVLTALSGVRVGGYVGVFPTHVGPPPPTVASIPGVGRIVRYPNGPGLWLRYPFVIGGSLFLYWLASRRKRRASSGSATLSDESRKSADP